MANSQITEAGTKWTAKEIEDQMILRGGNALEELLPAMAYLSITRGDKLPALQEYLDENVGNIAAGLKTNKAGEEDVVVFIERKDTKSPQLGMFSRIDGNTGLLGTSTPAIREKGRRRWHTDDSALPSARIADSVAMALAIELDTDDPSQTPEKEDFLSLLFTMSNDMLSSVRYNSIKGKFDNNKAKRGAYAPTKMLTEHNPSVFMLDADEKYREAEAPVFDLEKLRSLSCFQRHFDDFSDNEKVLIPGDMPDHIDSKEEAFIISELLRTHEKKASLRTTNFLLSGPAGTGKTESTARIANLLQRPRVVFTASASTTEDNLLGIILPVVSDGEEQSLNLSEEELSIYQAIKNAEADRFSIIDAVAEVCDLPSLETCYLSPEDAAEELGGEAEDASEAAALLDAAIGAKIAPIVAKAAKNVNGDAVRYQYIPSSIVTAIQKGYLLEIQEPTNVQQQGVFSCLYDVLEKSATGILQTPLGPVTRHNDFMCFVTTNTSYAGNRPLAVPFESRMQLSLDIQPPTKEVLAQRVIAKCGKDLAEIGKASEIVEVYAQALATCKEIGARGEPTPRALFTFADAVFDGVNPMAAFKAYILSFCSHEEEDRDIITDSVEDLKLMR